MGWEPALDAVQDTRAAPQIPTAVIVRSVAAMFLARLGSLNALEQSKPSGFWPKWIGQALPSADTIGRVGEGLDLDGIRRVGRQVYTRLKRGKALVPPGHGLLLAILDGHESHATYRRCCSGCLQRTIQTQHGPRVQYYHRHVTLQLAARDLTLLLDAEPLAPGEGEIAAALRLLDRVLEAYPRAFDVVLGDALYATSAFFNPGRRRGKHVLAVLKNEERDLWEDAQSLFAQIRPVSIRRGRWEARCWDLQGFTSWPQVSQRVRVVQAREQTTVRRQLDRQEQILEAHWAWVTTLPQSQASTSTVLAVGHRRWAIENDDHVYRHAPNAMLAFLLLAMICCNVFAAFYRRDLKPQWRQGVSMLHVARLIAAELYRPRAGAPLVPT